MTRLKCHVWAPEHLSIGIHRIVEALTIYAPPQVQIVPRDQWADHRVIQTIGWAGLGEAMGAVPTYSIFQLCRETTENGSLSRWANDVWREATVVASYYPLESELRDAGMKGLADSCRFLLTPLGVDTTVFCPQPHTRRGRFLVGTSGYVAASECVGEWVDVVERHGGMQFHLGPDLFPGRFMSATQFTSMTGLSDRELATMWSQCRYVSGLRRTEGFELPAAEGLCCGARPVLFDRGHHRLWFGNMAEYIQETDYAGVVRQLQALVASEYRPVTLEEIAEARKLFSWKQMATRFWEQVVQYA